MPIDRLLGTKEESMHVLNFILTYAKHVGHTQASSSPVLEQNNAVEQYLVSKAENVSVRECRVGLGGGTGNAVNYLVHFLDKQSRMCHIVSVI